MAIDLNSLANKAFTIAKTLTPQAFRKVQLQLSPVLGAYDPAADDHATTTWGYDSGVEGLQALPFDDEKERKDAPIESRMKVWMFDITELPQNDDFQLDTSGRITDATGSEAVIWEIYRTEIDPSKSLVLFYCQT